MSETEDGSVVEVGEGTGGGGRKAIPLQVKLQLMAASAGRCMYTGCNDELTADALTRKKGVYSVFAHIVADSPEGPRGHPTDSARLAGDPSNLMILCPVHHHLIDKVDVAGHPVHVLQAMKRDHEARVRYLTALHHNQRTRIITLAARIGNQTPILHADELRRAALPRFAVDQDVTLDLTKHAAPDGGPAFVAFAVEEIRLKIKDLRDQEARDGVHHRSVFALAPIPLLMALGRELGSVVSTEVHPRFRSPAGWTWPDEPSPPGGHPPFELELPPPDAPTRDLALLLQVSGVIDPASVSSVLPSGTPTCTLSLPRPAPDTVRSPTMLEDFEQRARELLSLVHARHGDGLTLHVFPAVPNAVAVAFGRLLLPKAHPAVKVYDRHPEGWRFVLDLLPQPP